MAVGIVQTSRFFSIKSTAAAVGAANGVGLFVLPKSNVQLIQVGYSFQDLAKLFVPGTGLFQARLVVLRGLYDADVTQLTPTTDLERWGMNKIADFDLNDIGPGVIPFNPDAFENIVGDYEGLSVLLSQGTSTTANTQFVGKLTPLGRFLTGQIGVARGRLAAASAGASGGAAGGGAGSGRNSGITGGGRGPQPR